MKTKLNKSGSIITRAELKNIKGGDDGGSTTCRTGSCTINVSGCGNQIGQCEKNSLSQCVCNAICVSGSAVTDNCKL